MVPCPRPGLARAAGLLLGVLLVLLAFRPASADVVYLYDPLGRLVRVIDETGQAATYIYDAVGNILQIARQTGIPQDQTSIATVDPPSGAQGTQVTLTFTGTNLAGASFPSLPAGLTFVSSSLSVSGNQDVLTIILAIDPEAPAGSQTLTLLSSLGGATPLPFSFQILPQPPKVDRLIPPIVTIGSLLQIEGARFDETNPSNNQVTINGVPLTAVSVRPGILIAQVPLGASTGPVTVTTPNGSAVSPAPLTVIPGSHPQQNQVTATLRNLFRTPGQIAVSPDGTRAYVQNIGGGGSVTVVDAVQAAVVANLGLGGAGALALTPDGTRLFVVRTFGLTVVDTATLGVLTTLSFPAQARGLAVSPDGAFAYVTVDASAQQGPFLSVVDLGTLTEAARITLAQPAALVAVAPDGSIIYAIGGQTAIIDAGTRQVLRTVTASIGVGTFALDHAGQRLYVAGVFPASGFLAGQVLNLQTGAVVQTLNAVTAVALSPDRTRLYTIDASGTFTVRNAATLATLGSAAVGGSPPNSTPSAMAVSPDGATLWFASSGNVLRAVDTQAVTLLAAVPVGFSPVAVGLIPSRGEVYVANRASNTVSVVDAATFSRRPTALDAFGLVQPLGVLVPADGAAAYVANGTVPTTVAFNPATGAAIATLLAGDAHPGVHLVPALSRSELIVGNSAPPGVRVLDLSTRQERRFLALAVPPRALALSLDERRLYVATELSAGSNVGTQLTAFDAATGAVIRQFTLDPSLVSDSIALNPEGTRLYVLHPTQGTSTNGLVRVIDTATFTQVATISVDIVSNRLVFNRTGQRLYAINANTVSVIDPSTNQVVASIPAFSAGANNSLVFSLDGSKAYLVGSGVKVINTATNTVNATLSGPSRAAALSPDGQRLFATRDVAPGSVTVINTATDQVIATIPVGAASGVAAGFRSINVTFSPDGSRAWVANTLDDSLSVIE